MDGREALTAIRITDGELKTLGVTAQEASQQVQKLTSSTADGVKNQAQLAAELRRVSDQLRSATNAHSAALRGRGDVQATQARLQSLREEQEALRSRIDALREGRAAAVQAQQATAGLAVVHARLSLELSEVQQHLALLRKAYLDPANEKHRAEIVNETAAYEQQRQAILGQIDALKRQGEAQEGSARSTGRATSFVSQLGFAFSDLQFAIEQPTRAVSVLGGNVSFLGSELVAMRAAAAASGQTLTSALLPALTGPAGIIAGLALVGSLATTVGPKLVDLFEGAADEAEELRDRAREVYDELVVLNGTDFELGLVFPTPGALRENVRGLAGLVDESEAEIARLKRVVEEGTTFRPDPITESFRRELNETAKDAEQQLERENELLATRRGLLSAATEQQEKRTEALEKRNQILQSGGAVDAEQFREQQEAERKAEKDREEAEERFTRLTREQAELRADLSIETIREARERELAEVERTYQERLAIARDNADLVALVEEAAAQERAAINLKYAEEATEAAAKFNSRLRELEDERRRLAGETEVSILEDRLAGLDARLTLLDEGTEAWREAYLEREALALELTKTLQSEADKMASDAVRAGNEWLREQKRQLDEAARAVAARTRIWEQFTRGALDALDAGFQEERRFTETQIDLQKARFEEEEDRLRESLENREITREQYELRLRALREDTAAFEDAVREDQLSKEQQALLTLTGYLRQQAIDYIKAELAKAAVAAARSAFENVAIPFPLNIAAAGAAIAAVQGLESIIRGIGGFASGGFIGDRGQAGPDSVLAMLAPGEAVANRHQQAAIEPALYNMYGFGLEELFRRIQTPHHFATGGFARAANPPRPARLPALSSGTDTAILDELRALRAEQEATRRRIADFDRNQQRALGDYSERIARTNADPHAARRQRRLAVRQDRRINPRRGSL